MLSSRCFESLDEMKIKSLDGVTPEKRRKFQQAIVDQLYEEIDKEINKRLRLPMQHGRMLIQATPWALEIAQMRHDQLEAAQQGLQQDLRRIPSSIAVLYNIPKRAHIHVIGCVCPSIDSTLTGKLGQKSLAVIVWILSDLTPNLHLSLLRVIYYEELHLKYAMAVARKKDCYWSSMEVHLFK